MALIKWKWPDKYGTTIDSFETLVSGKTVFTLPTNMTSYYRNYSLDFEFIDVSAGDSGLTVQFYNANSEDSLNAPNITPIETTIDFDAAVIANSTASFIRDFKNFDSDYFRVVITAPAGVTCKLKVIVRAGGAVG